MNGDQIAQNIKNALDKIMIYRVVITSPSELVADLPLLAVILVALFAFQATALIAVIALITGHRFRLEKGLPHYA